MPFPAGVTVRLDLRICCCSDSETALENLKVSKPYIQRLTTRGVDEHMGRCDGMVGRF